MILTLPSNASMNVFPENKANHFKTDLLRELDLSDGEYEVGLMEINFPHDFQKRNVYSNGENVSLRYSETEYEDFLIPTVESTSPFNLLEEFCRTHAYAWELLEYKFGYARVRLKEHSKFYQRALELVPGGTFHELISAGVDDFVDAPNFWRFSRCFVTSSGKPEITFFIKCSGPPSTIHFVDVHCNLIRPSEHAGVERRVLRSIFVAAKEGEEQTSVFEKPFYHSIDQKRVKVIEITLTDRKGNLIQFQRAPISVSLEIRRRGVESL